MKKNQLSALLAIVLPAYLSAQETATVKDSVVNVRGQPSLVGEVVTQLKPGEKVTILEEIVVEKPKPDEPAKWLRIKMPENTPVWVYAPYLDPTNKTVNVNRLNLRAGPGENFSVVGRIDRGAQLKDIRSQGDWLEVETPPGTYAFVAADLINRTEGGAQPVAAAPTSDATAQKQPQTTNSAPVVPPVARNNEPTNSVAQPATPERTVLLPPALVTTNEALRLPASTNTAVAPATPIPIPQPPVEQPGKRIVRREGIVRSTFSIQAPTYFELVSPESRKTINYIHTEEDTGLQLKDFKGKKIVVTGEEGIDQRWPNTPVIDVQSIELAP